MAHLQIVPKDPFGWWVTGLVDGEGCFYAGLNYRTKRTTSGRLVECVELQAEMAVCLRADDLGALEKLERWFGCGKINKKTTSAQAPSVIKQGIRPNPMRRFVVRAPEDLVSAVIPHFESYPLQSKKANDFEVWRSVVEFASERLIGKKGWLRRFPKEVAALESKCSELKAGRVYAGGSRG